MKKKTVQVGERALFARVQRALARSSPPYSLRRRNGKFDVWNESIHDYGREAIDVSLEALARGLKVLKPGERLELTTLEERWDAARKHAEAQQRYRLRVRIREGMEPGPYALGRSHDKLVAAAVRFAVMELGEDAMGEGGEGEALIIQRLLPWFKTSGGPGVKSGEQMILEMLGRLRETGDYLELILSAPKPLAKNERHQGKVVGKPKKQGRDKC